MELKMSAAEVGNFLEEVYPQMAGRFAVEELSAMQARVRLKVTDADLRPGGTVSGPSMFTLADCAFYIAVLGMIGKQAMTVTTNCSIDFMRKPAPGDLIAEVVLHKLGRVLAVGDVLMRSEGVEAPVARASVTYSIPPIR
ncbi:PaaI family thioesterase [Pontivivens nitratireducens]|uniref:PaaI family thioesterase n=1 Tax=Pontivivens nitratireducens TaxID=2758038 RepID=UPI00163B26E9|nr:PaaI family thioesterase [Pontibrevibacter nitratireducens]